MTHTLHRPGSPESLSRDYVLLFMPSKDINHVGSGPKLRRMLEIAWRTARSGSATAAWATSTTRAASTSCWHHVEDRAVVHAVFNDPDKVVAPR